MLSLFMIIIAYLLGSVSSAIIVCKAMNLPDPRSGGSNNPGASNVLRLAGKKAALIVLVADAVKGLIAVLLAKLFGVMGFGLALVALAAVVGHIFPLYFQFKGGKGVATALGAFLALSFWVGLVAIIVWLIIAMLSRYSSLASLCAVVLSAVLLLFVNTHYFLPVAVMTLLIIWAHWENIQRLQAGNESKIQL